MMMCQYNSGEQQALTLATLVAGQLQAAIAARGFASLAVSGGSSPQAFLTALNGQAVRWEAVRLTLVDERQVAETSPRSNLRFVREHLPVAVAKAEWLPLYQGESTHLDTVAQTLRERLLPLDVCVLGMGTDGHFASLFPGDGQLPQALDPDGNVLVLPVQPPGVPETRVSLTLAAMLSAAHLHLLVRGLDKWRVLEFAQQEGSNLPITRLLASAGERLLVHYAD